MLNNRTDLATDRDDASNICSNSRNPDDRPTAIRQRASSGLFQGWGPRL